MAKRRKIVVGSVRARPGSGYSAMDVKAICAEAERMARSGSRITPVTWEKRARPKSSPIHHLFDWDTERAAYRWRLFLAGRQLAAVEFVVERVDRPVRMFHSVTMDVETGPARREYVHRDLVVYDAARLATIHADRFAQVRALALGAEGLGLQKRFAFWRKLLPMVGEESARIGKHTA